MLLMVVVVLLLSVLLLLVLLPVLLLQCLRIRILQWSVCRLGPAKSVSNAVASHPAGARTVCCWLACSANLHTCARARVLASQVVRSATVEFLRQVHSGQIFMYDSQLGQM